jgi:hypothetical protein
MLETISGRTTVEKELIRIWELRAPIGHPSASIGRDFTGPKVPMMRYLRGIKA